MIALVASLGSGFYYLMKDQGDKTKRRLFHSLGVRLSLAIGLAALITLFGAQTIALASILGPFAMIRLGLSLFGVKAMGLLPILKAVGTAFMWLGRA